MTNSQKMEAILKTAKINTRRVKVLGSYVHIDTFHKYENAITDMMSLAGFGLLMANDGRHMDGVDGFRLVYKLAA